MKAVTHGLIEQPTLIYLTYNFVECKGFSAFRFRISNSHLCVIRVYHNGAILRFFCPVQRPYPYSYSYRWHFMNTKSIICKWHLSEVYARKYLVTHVMFLRSFSKSQLKITFILDIKGGKVILYFTRNSKHSKFNIPFEANRKGVCNQ